MVTGYGYGLWFQAMVPGHLSDHTGQERHLGHETAPSPGHFLQCRLVNEAQAYAGFGVELTIDLGQ